MSMKSNRVTIWIDDISLAQLDEFAKENGISRSALIRILSRNLDNFEM